MKRMGKIVISCLVMGVMFLTSASTDTMAATLVKKSNMTTLTQNVASVQAKIDLSKATIGTVKTPVDTPVSTVTTPEVEVSVVKKIDVSSLQDSTVLKGTLVGTIEKKEISVATKTPGLYRDGAMVFTWDDIINNGFISVDGNAASYVNTSYGRYAQWDQNAELVLPETITSLKAQTQTFGRKTLTSGAFSNAAMKSINAPGLTEVANDAFKNCENLASVTLPSVTKIGITSFMNCPALMNVNAPKCTKVESGAFWDSEALKLVTLAPNASVAPFAYKRSTGRVVDIPDLLF